MLKRGGRLFHAKSLDPGRFLVCYIAVPLSSWHVPRYLSLSGETLHGAICSDFELQTCDFKLQTFGLPCPMFR